MPLLNFYKPRFSQAENMDFLKFIARQRQLAGMQPCCTSCVAAETYFTAEYVDKPLDTQETLLDLAEKGVLWRKHLMCPPNRQLHTICPERIDILPYKTITFACEDADAEIFVWPETKTMTIGAAAKDEHGRVVHQFAESGHYLLPEVKPGALERVTDCVERRVVNYLKDINLLAAIPEELEEEWTE